MSETVNDLIAEVRTFVDVDAASALKVFNRRYSRMVAVSRAMRRLLEIALVDGQAFYELMGDSGSFTNTDGSELVEVLGVSVDGVTYSNTARRDVSAYGQSTLSWTGPGGLVAIDADVDGNTGLTVIPTPGTGTLQLYAAVTPSDLTGSEDVTTLRVDRDMHEALIQGTAATFLDRQGEGDPGSLEARFEAACVEMRTRVARRYRGGGPSQIRVVGINA
jgi:hypothetical protein